MPTGPSNLENAMKRNLPDLLFREFVAFIEPLPATEPEVLPFFDGIGYHFDKIFGAADAEQLKKDWKGFRDACAALAKAYRDREKLVEEIRAVDLPGVNITEIREFVNAYPENLADLIAMASDLGKQAKPIGDFFNTLKATASKVKNAAQNQALVDAVGRLPDRVMALLLYRYLTGGNEAALPLLDLFGLVRRDDVQKEVKVGNDVVVSERTFPRLDFPAAGNFVKAPSEHFKKLYWKNGFGPDSTKPTPAEVRFANTNAAGLAFFGKLQAVLDAFHMLSVVGDPSADYFDTSLGTDSKERLKGMMAFHWPFFDANTEAEGEVGAGLGFLVDDALDKGPGMFAVPFGNLSFRQIFRNWALEGAGQLDTQGFKVNRDGLAFFNPSAAATSAKLDLFLNPTSTDPTLWLLGATKGPRIEIGRPSMRVTLKANAAGKAECLVALDLKGSALAVSGKGAGGFWGKLIGNEVRMPFDFAIAWSNVRGVHIEGAASLEIGLASSLNLFNVLRIDRLRLALRVDQERFGATLVFDANLKIGPVQGAAGGLGMTAAVLFPKNGATASTELAFQTPNSIKLALNTSSIALGGHIERSGRRYTGVLQISIKQKFNLTAIGILDTQMPDGSDGYSLLMIIVADGFAPIQLGMGFALTGVGGLIALHRTMDPDALRKGIRDSSIEHILFPKNPLDGDNAAQIVRSLDAAFPIKEGQFVFGPMARITWGSGKAIIQLDIGLFIELPDPVRVAIPGILRSQLPDDRSAKIHLQANFIGILDFEKRTVSFDATIFNSRIANFSLSGDLVLRLCWGDQPNFLLSVGGFNPRFSPPPGLPSISRIAMSLLDEEKAKVRMQFYLAITSNTVQTGARVDAEFRVAGFNVVGYLSFDALFQFQPFRFWVDIAASFSVQTKKGKELLVASLSFALEGPNPWIISGKATFKVVGIEYSTDFYKELRAGDAPPPASLPDVALLPLLQAEFRKAEAWQSLPARSANGDEKPDLVRLRSDARVIHPAGSLVVSQRVAPLGTTLQRFGNGRLADGTRFDIGYIRLNGGSGGDLQLTAVSDHFAQAQYLDLTDDQKLSAPSFSAFKNGVSATFIGSGAASLKTGTACVVDGSEAELVMVGSVSPGTYKWNSTDFSRLSRTASSGLSPLSPRFRTAPPPTRLGGDEAGGGYFCIVDAGTLRPFDGTRFPSESECRAALGRLFDQDPILEGRLRTLPERELPPTGPPPVRRKVEKAPNE